MLFFTQFHWSLWLLQHFCWIICLVCLAHCRAEEGVVIWHNSSASSQTVHTGKGLKIQQKFIFNSKMPPKNSSFSYVKCEFYVEETRLFHFGKKFLLYVLRFCLHMRENPLGYLDKMGSGPAPISLQGQGCTGIPETYGWWVGASTPSWCTVFFSFKARMNLQPLVCRETF